jgi:hypothetical protein
VRVVTRRAAACRAAPLCSRRRTLRLRAVAGRDQAWHASVSQHRILHATAPAPLCWQWGKQEPDIQHGRRAPSRALTAPPCPPPPGSHRKRRPNCWSRKTRSKEWRLLRSQGRFLSSIFCYIGCAAASAAATTAAAAAAAHGGAAARSCRAWGLPARATAPRACRPQPLCPAACRRPVPEGPLRARGVPAEASHHASARAPSRAAPRPRAPAAPRPRALAPSPTRAAGRPAI